MKGALLAVALVCVSIGTYGLIKSPATSPAGVKTSKVGNDPGHIREGWPLKPLVKGDQLAAFSMGCFWNSEHVYREVKGVVATAVGFTGGFVPHPTYEQVCTHTTGQAETVLVEFNPTIVSYNQLLNVFWANTDPTTVDREGPDEGNNYRSAIWATSKVQLQEAMASEAIDQKKEKAPIVTEIRPLGRFWMAEEYHQQYDEKNGIESCPNPRDYPSF